MIEIRWDQQSATLDDTAQSVLRRAGIKSPPVSAIELARRLGYAILWDDKQQARARIAQIRAARLKRPRCAIFLRPEPRIERVHWAIAHELGEACAAHVFECLDTPAAEVPPQQRERIANALATRLLLPLKWFAHAAHEVDRDLLRLKERFATASHELIARRLFDLPSPVIISIFDHGKLQFRRGNGRQRALPPGDIEVRLWRAAHESGQHAHNMGPPRIDVWPIHEPGWKREIMRTEPDSVNGIAAED